MRLTSDGGDLTKTNEHPLERTRLMTTPIPRAVLIHFSSAWRDETYAAAAGPVNRLDLLRRVEGRNVALRGVPQVSERVDVAMLTMRKLLAVSVALFLGACAGPFEYTARPYPNARWDVGAVTVSIRDPRPTVAATPPEVPAVTMGGEQGAEVRLPPEFAEFVKYRLGQLTSRTGPPVQLDIIVDKARAAWSASAVSETEKGDVALRFRILAADGRLLVEGRGVGSREFSSMDASDDELAKVFRAACNDAFDQFFGNPANIRFLNSRR
jgi:hypothetical protein